MTRRAQALHGIAFLLAACLAQAEPFGYVINSDSLADAGFDNLYRVDLSNGAATQIGPVGYGDVEGLALSPEGVLYGVDDNTETLIIIDTGTGQGAPVNNTASNLTLGPDGLELGASYDFGLAFDVRGRLWLSSDVTGQLWRVDPATGEPTLVSGGSGSPAATESGDGTKSHDAREPHVTGLAACGTTLFGLTVGSPHKLVHLNPPEDIGEITLLAQFDDAGLDFGAEALWGIADQSRIGDNVLNDGSIIFTVDPATGSATRVATTIVGVESLAVSAPGPCPADQAASHSIPAGSGPGFLLLVLGVGLVAAYSLRARA